MKTININGIRTGKFNILNFTNSYSIPISSYDGNIISVISTNMVAGSALSYYVPGSNTNPFNSFEPNRAYLIFAKKNFTIDLDTNTENDKFVLSGNSNGIYNFFDYEFNNDIPFNLYSNNLKSEFLYSSLSADMLLWHKQNRQINPLSAFETDRIYLINASKNFVVYNPDFSAIQLENFQEPSGWMLKENGIDRLLLE
jgi:hypothetical protein